jgi:hypothetical protein
MAYSGTERGKKKALASVRLVHQGAGAAQLYKDLDLPSSVTISTSTWLELFNSSAAKVTMVEIFSSSGEVEILATGDSGLETVLFRIIPGGGGYGLIQIDAATRICYRPESVVPGANSELIINFFN